MNTQSWGMGPLVSKKRLDSWKEIADFLGRSVRTVQRWHECNRLPVHHFGGHKGSVFGYEEEIDHWLAGLAGETATSQAPAEAGQGPCRQSTHELSATADAMWETRSERNIRTIADLYRKAIDHDGTDASAFTGLANAMIYCALHEIVDATMAYPSAVEALRRIPQLDSEHLDAKCSAAWIDMLYNRNWRQARAGFEEIVRKRPTSFALSGLAAMHVAEGRLGEAFDCAWEAWKRNPLVGSLGGILSWIVYLSGDFGQALEMVAQMRSGGGGGSLATVVEALVLVQDKRLTTHLDRLEKAAMEFRRNHTLQGILAYAYGMVGEKSKAREKQAYLAHGSETRMKSNAYALALVSMGLDNRQEAIARLEASYAEGTLWSLGFRTDPVLWPLRGDGRFERLAGRIGSSAQLRGEEIFEGPTPVRRLGEALAVENP